jgi:EAL domain-containing protein (putative c-di-GMP-specific phosphodiesterase class I)
VLARLGGDEFAILLTDATDARTVSSVSDRIQESLNTPVIADGREYLAKASVGIAFSNAHYRTSEDLLRDADTAMYRAKDLGRSQAQTFEPSMHAAALGRLTLETELRRALERQEFILYYQPIIDLVRFEVSGFEALVRWPRGDGSLVAPVDFVPVAEDAALIAPLTSWVLGEACSQAAVWQRRFGLPLSVSVNISTKLFDRHSLVDEVRAAITSTGLLPGTLRLEITESFLVSDTAAVARRLSELRAIPVGLYLDDFGTGYSSLSYLHRYQIDALKIDRSFISRIGTTGNEAPIVSSIVNLAKELGMGVIAEGVETVTQAEHLIALGCPAAQGLFFSVPLSVQETESFLHARPTLRSLIHPRTAAPGNGYVPLTH